MLQPEIGPKLSLPPRSGGWRRGGFDPRRAATDRATRPAASANVGRPLASCVDRPSHRPSPCRCGILSSQAGRCEAPRWRRPVPRPAVVPCRNRRRGPADRAQAKRLLRPPHVAPSCPSSAEQGGRPAPRRFDRPNVEAWPDLLALGHGSRPWHLDALRAMLRRRRAAAQVSAATLGAVLIRNVRRQRPTRFHPRRPGEPLATHPVLGRPLRPHEGPRPQQGRLEPRCRWRRCHGISGWTPRAVKSPRARRESCPAQRPPLRRHALWKRCPFQRPTPPAILWRGR